MLIKYQKPYETNNNNRDSIQKLRDRLCQLEATKLGLLSPTTMERDSEERGKKYSHHKSTGITLNADRIEININQGRGKSSIRSSREGSGENVNMNMNPHSDRANKEEMLAQTHVDNLQLPVDFSNLVKDKKQVKSRQKGNKERKLVEGGNSKGEEGKQEPLTQTEITQITAGFANYLHAQQKNPKDHAHLVIYKYLIYR